MNFLAADKGAACGPGEVLTSWAIQPCTVGGNEDSHSYFKFGCQPVGGRAVTLLPIAAHLEMFKFPPPCPSF
jgi:hypothetical protein